MHFLHSKFQNIKPYTPGEQLNNPEVIKLNTNENPYPTPANVIEAATNAAVTLSRYSDPTAREVIEPLAASIFHYGEVKIPDLKQALQQAQIPVREV